MCCVLIFYFFFFILESFIEKLFLFLEILFYYKHKASEKTKVHFSRIYKNDQKNIFSVNNDYYKTSNKIIINIACSI